MSKLDGDQSNSEVHFWKNIVIILYEAIIYFTYSTSDT